MYSNKIRLVLVFSLYLFADFAFAQAEKSCPPEAEKPTVAATQAAMGSARDHGFLWRITKDGHASFLYGTIHVAKFDWII